MTRLVRASLFVLSGVALVLGVSVGCSSYNVPQGTLGGASGAGPSSGGIPTTGGSSSGSASGGTSNGGTSSAGTPSGGTHNEGSLAYGTPSPRVPVRVVSGAFALLLVVSAAVLVF